MLTRLDPRFSHLTLRLALRSLADFVMPRGCVVCGRELLPGEDAVCVSCMAELPRTYFWTRKRNPMADAFNARIDAPSYCYAAALFYYGEDSGYQNITRSLKYSRNFDSGRRFARILGECLRGAAEFEDVDCVVPVPLHWTRRFSRGYNQAEVIAKEVASALGARLEPGFLRRVRRTRSQARLLVGEKAGNVAGAFAATPRAFREAAGSVDHILLIDDVFTTGATSSECYSALRSAFGDSVRISVATLAYVGHI